MSVMSRKKRLFLFAGYDKDGIIDDTLVYYVNRVSKFGDVVLVLDSSCDDTQIAKIKKYCTFVAATRHGEYDFGSYKRAYLWAKENLDMKNYDFVYMLNDSVYGPFFDMEKYFNQMESDSKYDAFGMVDKIGGRAPHIQSWFIGMRPTVFMSKWFDEFIKSVRHQNSKGLVAILYETGFSQLLDKHNMKYRCLYHVFNRGVYKKIKSLYNRGMPFMKKVAFLATDGALGHQIKYVLNRIPNDLSAPIIANAKRSYGTDYVTRVLKSNVLTGCWIAIKHATRKIISGKI